MPSSSEQLSRERLRAAIRELEQRGLSGDLDELVRAGAAEMILRSCRAFDGAGKGPGWLATVIRNGGPWNAPAPDDGLTERDRERCAAFDSLMADSGLMLGSAA